MLIILMALQRSLVVWHGYAYYYSESFMYYLKIVEED
jgi:hypothetical protein